MKTRQFVLSAIQISRLKKMLPKTSSTVDVPKLVSLLEQVGQRYQRAVRLLDHSPSQETWDRCMASRAYATKLSQEHSRLSLRQGVAMSDRVAKADQELVRLCSETARIWKQASGRKLPIWPAPKAREAKRDRTVVASKHPLGLMLDALGVYVSVSSIAQLARLGRRGADKPEKVSE